MKKGFTIIESIISIVVFTLMLILIIRVNVSLISQNKNNIDLDTSYNLAKAICEKYKSERTTIDNIQEIKNKTVVYYIDGIEDLNRDIAEILLNTPAFNVNDNQQIRANNIMNKEHIVIMTFYVIDSLEFLEVNAMSSQNLEIRWFLRTSRSVL